MPIVVIPLWLAQNNWLSSTEQSKAPYIAAARVPISVQFLLCHRKAERVRMRIFLDLEFNIRPCVSPTTMLPRKNVCYSCLKYCDVYCKSR
jgi:hypothetical protein